MKFVCVLSVLCGLTLTARALDREAFTFTRYDLKATVEPEQQRLGVRGRITLRNDSDAPQRNIVLQISSTLHWSSIQFEGKPVEFVTQQYTSDIDHTGALSEAIVVLPHTVTPKQSIELEIGYEGVIPQDASRLTRIGVPEDTAKHSDWDQIARTFTAVRGIGYVAWYPIATEVANLSEASSVSDAVGRWQRREANTAMTVQFTFLSSEGIRSNLYCNGLAKLLLSEDMGHAHSSQVACDFLSLGTTAPSFLIGSYEVVDHPPVSISYLPEHKSGADDYALAVEQVSPSIAKWFGDHREKPDEKAQLVELPDSGDAPFESGNLLLMAFTGDDTTYLLSAVQQLTHLMFPSPRAWIGAGLARYAQARYMEEEKGRGAAIAYLEAHRVPLLGAEKAETEHVSAPASNHATSHSLTNSDDNFYVQAKAMNVWWMLRDLVGETAFTAALHNYNPRDDKDPQYMQKLIQAQAHRDLAWFFDDWVYQDRGLPDLRIDSVYVSPRENGAYISTITVQNLGDAGAEVSVTLHLAEGEATQKLIVRAKVKASIRIVAPAPPNEVTVNDGSVPELRSDSHVYKIEGTH